jgi:hypothetical protein
LTPIGAGWYFHLQSHLPEAGWVPTDLYRDWKGKPVLVAKNIEQHQFYEPDCVVFVTGHADPPYVTYAACGDRLPVAIDVRDYRHWTLGPDGPRYEHPARVVDGVPTKWTETIALDRIKEVAVRPAAVRSRLAAQPPRRKGRAAGRRGRCAPLAVLPNPRPPVLPRPEAAHRWSMPPRRMWAPSSTDWTAWRWSTPSSSAARRLMPPTSTATRR